MINNIFFKTILGVFVGIFSIFTPIYPMLLTIVIVSIIDLFTAITKDIIKTSKDKNLNFFNKLAIIKSKKLRRTTIKIILYLILAMLLYLIPMISFNSSLYIINIGVFMILSNELFSIGENMNIITGNNIFGKIIKKVINFSNEKLNKMIEN